MRDNGMLTALEIRMLLKESSETKVEQKDKHFEAKDGDTYEDNEQYQICRAPSNKKGNPI